MTGYLDNENKDLRRGFYGYRGSEELIYFTGKYNEETGFPKFEKEEGLGKEVELHNFIVKTLYQVDEIVVREKIDGLKIKTKWLEKRIEEI